MAEELKIRIRDYKKIEENLIRLGAKFSEEIDVIDTYFKQSAGEVLKITQDNKGNFLVNLKSKNGKFEIVKYEPIDNVDETKDELTKKFGVSGDFLILRTIKSTSILLKMLASFLLLRAKI